MATAHVVVPDAAEVPEREVITRVGATPVLLIAFFSLPAVVGLLTSPGLLTLAAVIAHGAVTARVAQISLSVSSDGVHVHNFFKHRLVPLWEADPVLEEHDEIVFLSDSGGRLDKQARTLFIEQPWSDSRINVGAVPRYGEEPDRVHRELNDSILRYRRYF